MHSRTDLTLDVSNLILTKVEPITTEKLVSKKTTAETHEEQDSRLLPPKSLSLNKHHSHSSGEVTDKTQRPSIGSALDSIAPAEEITSKSQASNTNIISSRSENSLKTIGDTLQQAILSPSSTAKEIVLSPFSKLAKGGNEFYVLQSV